MKISSIFMTTITILLITISSYASDLQKSNDGVVAEVLNLETSYNGSNPYSFHLGEMTATTRPSYTSNFTIAEKLYNAFGGKEVLVGENLYMRKFHHVKAFKAIKKRFLREDIITYRVEAATYNLKQSTELAEKMRKNVLPRVRAEEMVAYNYWYNMDLGFNRDINLQLYLCLSASETLKPIGTFATSKKSCEDMARAITDQVRTYHASGKVLIEHANGIELQTETKLKILFVDRAPSFPRAVNRSIYYGKIQIGDKSYNLKEMQSRGYFRVLRDLGYNLMYEFFADDGIRVQMEMDLKNQRLHFLVSSDQLGISYNQKIPLRKAILQPLNNFKL